EVAGGGAQRCVALYRRLRAAGDEDFQFFVRIIELPRRGSRQNFGKAGLGWNDHRDAGLVDAHGRPARNSVNSAVPRSSSRTEIHSSAVCACAMSPGPKTTLGIPACP